MTEIVILIRLQRIWKKWNIRGSILASLFFQIWPIFLAPIRKRSRRYFTTIMLWSAYLLADYIAFYAIGLISDNQGDKCDESNLNDGVSAFWTPFLLLHLGGPDSITAFSLEDNELWIRHLFGLVAELLLTAYVFTQATPSPFWLPTVLVFLAGVIKYAERIRALYLASLDNFIKSSMEGDTRKFPEDVLDFIKSKPKTPMEMTLEEIDIVRLGFHLYKADRRLIVDQKADTRSKGESFFSGFKVLDAFRVMEIELNFMYDALFTKLAMVHGSYFWYICRFICIALIAASLFLFKPRDIHPLDIAITYSLLIGAIILEIVSLVKLVFSDWTVALLKSKSRKAEIRIYKIRNFISFQGRWSNSMARYNLISLCLKRQFMWFKLLDKVTEFFGLKEIFELLMYRKFIPVEDALKSFIFKVIEENNSSSRLYYSRGVDAVKRRAKRHSDSFDNYLHEDMTFEKVVLMWHIATDLMYYKDNSDDHHKKLCKILSDYMSYLIAWQPSLISAIPSTSRIAFQAICEKSKKIVGGKMNKNVACREILSLSTPPSKPPLEWINLPEYEKVFYRACELGNNLERLKNEVKIWNMMSEVWIELLCYGASHCRGHVHAQQLSKGGELVTFVWLLMSHFQICERTSLSQSSRIRDAASEVSRL